MAKNLAKFAAFLFAFASAVLLAAAVLGSLIGLTFSCARAAEPGSGTGGAPPGWPVAEMNAAIDQTNFLVGDGCSGTLIDAEHGYILTAQHCVTGQFRTIEREKIDGDGVIKKEKVRVTLPGTVTQIHYKSTDETWRVSHTYKVVLSDEKLDLALLKMKVPPQTRSQASFACDNPERGSAAYVVGNPHGVLYASVTKGIVSSVTRSYPVLGVTDQDDNGLMQVSAGVIGGNSGGAVYNHAGELIGVPVRASPRNEILGFAVPLADVKKFLTREGLDRLWGRCPK